MFQVMAHINPETAQSLPSPRLPAPGSRLPAPGSRLPAPGSRLILYKQVSNKSTKQNYYTPYF
ncbi:hypothetical protein AGMMS50268_21380 [Spirochaetia bacterium]|nr:hypothetical protein AGMMS50268_21380 [Spirochaetia bacterium]